MLCRAKPKLHMLQELCEMGPGNPARHATYRDEESGGSIVSLGRWRGGPSTPASVGQQALNKLCAAFVVPRP